MTMITKQEGVSDSMMMTTEQMGQALTMYDDNKAGGGGGGVSDSMMMTTEQMGQALTMYDDNKAGRGGGGQ